MIKVLMVGVSPKRNGGMWTVAQNYMHSDRLKQDVELKYIATSTNGTKITRLVYMLWGYCRIVAYLLGHKVDIVHVHMAEKGSVYRKGVVVKLGKKFGCKVIIHMHAGPFIHWYKSKPAKAQTKIVHMLNCADKILVLGEYWKDSLKEILPMEKMEVLYNGVAIPVKNNYNASSKKIIYMGVIKKEKGINELLQAMKLLDPMLDEEIKLYLYGIDLEGDVEEKIAHYQLTDRVILGGWIGEAEREKVLKEAMLSVLPSFFEGLSMSIIEAMSYGIPVVTTEISTMRELVGEEITLVQPGSAEALAQEIEKYCVQEDLRKRDSFYLYERARTLFSIESNVSHLLKIYKSLLQ